MGTHGSPPTRSRRSLSSGPDRPQAPADLQVDPETLSTIPMTLEDHGRPHPDPERPAGLVAQVSPLDRSEAPPVGRQGGTLIITRTEPTNSDELPAPNDVTFPVFGDDLRAHVIRFFK
jgi:hypothetical protein